MTAEERIAQLEQENAQLRAELAAAYQQIAHLTDRLRQVEGDAIPIVVEGWRARKQGSRAENRLKK